MTVFDIRGTHASGKSTLVATMLVNHKWEEIIGPGQATKGGPLKDRQLGYECVELNAAVVGAYSMETMRGGCDLLFPEEVVRRVLLFNESYKVVILEGILVAHTFERYSLLAKEVEDYRFCFLNTPLNQCIKHLDQRREGLVGNHGKPRNVKNLVKDYKQINGSVRTKCLDAGHTVVDIKWTEAYDQVMKMLNRVIKRSTSLS